MAEINYNLMDFTQFQPRTNVDDMKDLSGIFDNVTETNKKRAIEQAYKQAVDPQTGKVDRNKLVSILGSVDPQLAMKEEQNSFTNDKNKYELDNTKKVNEYSLYDSESKKQLGIQNQNKDKIKGALRSIKSLLQSGQNDKAQAFYRNAKMSLLNSGIIDQEEADSIGDTIDSQEVDALMLNIDNQYADLTSELETLKIKHKNTLEKNSQNEDRKDARATEGIHSRENIAKLDNETKNAIANMQDKTKQSQYGQTYQLLRERFENAKDQFEIDQVFKEGELLNKQVMEENNQTQLGISNKFEERKVTAQESNAETNKINAENKTNNKDKISDSVALKISDKVDTVEKFIRIDGPKIISNAVEAVNIVDNLIANIDKSPINKGTNAISEKISEYGSTSESQSYMNDYKALEKLSTFAGLQELKHSSASGASGLGQTAVKEFEALKSVMKQYLDADAFIIDTKQNRLKYLKIVRVSYIKMQQAGQIDIEIARGILARGKQRLQNSNLNDSNMDLTTPTNTVADPQGAPTLPNTQNPDTMNNLQRIFGQKRIK